MKTIVSAFAAGLLAASFAAAPAKAGPNSCPAFTSAMIDATAAAAGLIDVEIFLGQPFFDDPASGDIACTLEMNQGSLFIEVGPYGRLLAYNDGGPSSTHGTVITGVEYDGPLTTGQRHACRAAVVQSLVWTTYCAPHLP